MYRYFIAILLLLLGISGCGTFYKNPSSGQPSVTLIEKSERKGLGWYRNFTLAEVDGKPVSHMFTSTDGNMIQIEPGTRKLLITVGYLSREGNPLADTDGCQCRAVFPLELNLEAGKRFQLGGTVSADHHVVITLTDMEKPDTPWFQANAIGKPVPKNMTIAVPGGGFVTIPGK